MIVVILLAITALVFFLNGGGSAEKTNSSNPEPAYRSNKWEVNLELGNKNPYGLYVFQELLIAHGKFSEFNDYTDYTLLDSICELDSSLYMYLGMDFTFTKEETERLLEGVARGNELFLSVQKPPKHLFEYLFKDSPLTFQPEDSVLLHTTDGQYPMYYIYQSDTLTDLWNMFKPQLLADSIKKHTTAFGHPLYIEIPHGEGSIFVHLNPVIFTNFQLLRDAGKAYFKSFVKTLDHPKIQYLSFAKYEPFKVEPDMTPEAPQESLLSELFKYPPFRWAFIMAIFGLLLYFFFRSKREKPIIPAFEKSKNSGYAYADTLAGIYFQGNHSGKILRLMKRNFYDAVYKKFYIDLAGRKSSKPIVALANKSGVEQEKIEHLLKLLETNFSISDDFVSKAYLLQRDFYFRSGIWNEREKVKLDEQYTIIYRSKSQGVSLIISGILLIMFGFMLLSSTIGWGVLLWPLGIFTLALGGRIMGYPIIKMNKREIIYQPLIGKPRNVRMNDVTTVTRDGDLLRFNIHKGAALTINLQNIGKEYRQNLTDLKTIINAK